MKESVHPVTISFLLRVPGRSLPFCGAELSVLQNRVAVALHVNRDCYSDFKELIPVFWRVPFLSRLAGGTLCFRVE
jgi:hypothetical protein